MFVVDFMLRLIYYRLMFSVYILYSIKLQRYYIGTTNDVDRRLFEHNTILYPNSYTEKGIPWSLDFVISGLSSKQAFEIEKHIKRMKSRQYIFNLKSYP